MPDPSSEPDPDTSRSNIEPHVMAFFAIVLPPLSSIAVLKWERSNAFVRFHAMQSALFGALVIAGYLGLFGLALALRESGPTALVLIASFGTLFVMLWLIVWIVQMVAALSRREWQIPYLGRLARRLLNR